MSQATKGTTTRIAPGTRPAATFSTVQSHTGRISERLRDIASLVLEVAIVAISLSAVVLAAVVLAYLAGGA